MAQIGTIKVDTQNSGAVDVPVFETGDSSSDIYEFVRVQTAGGTGFIPVTNTTDAAYPYLRVQSQNNGIVAVTDTAESVIPQQPYQDPLVEPASNNIEAHSGASNPVLSAADVSDVSDVLFVADPFIFRDSDESWHIFMEVRKGPDSGDYAVTGHATSSDGLSWTYDQVVIDAGYQTSHPYIFKDGGDYYIVHGQSEGDIRLWKADTFPTSWSVVNTLADSANVAASTFKDPTIFKWTDDNWWILCGGDAVGEELNAYYSNTLETDNWNEHGSNPVKTGAANAWRPGGRVIWWDDGGTDRLFIPYQHMDPNYGDDINYYEITDLTSSSFSDVELAAQMFDSTKTKTWNSERMHHYDPWWQTGEGRWLSAVDGYDGSEWKIGIYQHATITDNTVTEV